MSLQVLEKRIRKELNKSHYDIESIKKSHQQIEKITSDMRKRVDEYYSSVNAKHIELKPMEADVIIDYAKKRFLSKYPDAILKITINTDRKILSDVSSLGEALSNIMINAYEANLANGNKEKIYLTLNSERLWTVFTIKDRGGGLNRKQIKNIFQPFYTTKSKNDNWGMGLFYTKKIIRQHFGLIKVESVEGEGSSFLVLLPSYDSRAR